MKKSISAMSVMASIAFLSACGGGGGGDSSGSVADAGRTGANQQQSGAEGAYDGSTSTDDGFSTIVLENGEFWTLYGNDPGSGFVIGGLIQGRGTANNGSFTASDVRNLSVNGQAASGTLSASYVANTRLNGTFTFNGSNIAFTAEASDPSIYNYNTQANLSQITGAWTVPSTSGGSFNIAAGGALNGSVGGCTFTGNIVPRPSGKNVFDVSATFGGAPCNLPNQQVSGIGISYSLPNNQRQLIVTTVNNARDSAYILASVR